MITATIILFLLITLLAELHTLIRFVKQLEIQAQKRALQVQIRINAKGMASDVKKEGKKLLHIKKQWQTPAGIYNKMYTFFSNSTRYK